ncbi:hypothetical protein ABK040_001958 [Willaertia magna]
MINHLIHHHDDDSTNNNIIEKIKFSTKGETHVYKFYPNEFHYAPTSDKPNQNPTNPNFTSIVHAIHQEIDQDIISDLDILYDSMIKDDHIILKSYGGGHYKGTNKQLIYFGCQLNNFINPFNRYGSILLLVDAYKLLKDDNSKFYKFYNIGTRKFKYEYSHVLLASKEKVALVYNNKKYLKSECDTISSSSEVNKFQWNAKLQVDQDFVYDHPELAFYENELRIPLKYLTIGFADHKFCIKTLKKQVRSKEKITRECKNAETKTDAFNRFFNDLLEKRIDRIPISKVYYQCFCDTDDYKQYKKNHPMEAAKIDQFFVGDLKELESSNEVGLNSNVNDDNSINEAKRRRESSCSISSVDNNFMKDCCDDSDNTDDEKVKKKKNN